MYYLKDIIFGLRDEYIKNQSRLAELKMFVVADKNKVDDYNFRTTFDNEIVKIIINIEERQTYLKKMLNFIKKGISGEDDLSTLEVVKNKFLEYWIKPNKYGLEVKEAFCRNFDSLVTSIMTKDTIYNIGSCEKTYCDDGFNYRLIINPDFTELTCLDEDYFTSCRYVAKDDEIIVKTKNAKYPIIEEDVFDILNLVEIDKDLVPLYNQNVIDKTIDRNNIIINLEPTAEEMRLGIKKENNNYVLKMKR